MSAPDTLIHRLAGILPPSLRRKLSEGGEALVDRALCAAGALLFSQAPEFMQQYLQRLGGHLDEARRQLAQFQEVAARSGLSLERLISQTSTSADPAVAKLAGVMGDAQQRVEALAAAHAALLDASALTRPFVFLWHYDGAIAGGTWSVFKPAVPTTLEGLCYALTGMVVMLAAYHFGLKRLWLRRGSAPA